MTATFSSYSYSQISPISNKQFSELKFDTSKTAIIELKSPLNWIFDSTYKPSKLIQTELSIIDSLLIIAVNDFNSWQEKNNSDHPWNIDLKSRNYRKQIVAVINKQGEKEVWVNCFCSSGFVNWKSKPVIVDDGATCFFNFKINLNKYSYYSFLVNSAA